MGCQRYTATQRLIMQSLGSYSVPQEPNDRWRIKTCR